MMSLRTSLELDMLILDSCWQLIAGVNGYKSEIGEELVTQAATGRNFQIIHIPFSSNDILNNKQRIYVRLLEDGYNCWLKVSEILGKALLLESWQPDLLNNKQIKARIPKVLQWLEKRATFPNQYLWGGTIGPDFDCSGLVQSAFASEGIWLPRDAYQQEKFCQRIEFSLENYQFLKPGDLLFFGTQEICNHVAVYIGNGSYCHSSGATNGSNGIAINTFNDIDTVSSYYQSLFRSAGRVERCHDGSKLS